MIFWQSRNRYMTSKIAMGVAEHYKQLDLPVGVLVIDYKNQVRVSLHHPSGLFYLEGTPGRDRVYRVSAHSRLPPANDSQQPPSRSDFNSCCYVCYSLTCIVTQVHDGDFQPDPLCFPDLNELQTGIRKCALHRASCSCSLRDPLLEALLRSIAC